MSEKSKKIDNILSRLDMFETNLVKMQAAIEGMKEELAQAEEADIAAETAEEE
jgi:archaellum component FlaC